MSTSDIGLMESDLRSLVPSFLRSFVPSSFRSFDHLFDHNYSFIHSFTHRSLSPHQTDPGFSPRSRQIPFLPDLGLARFVSTPGSDFSLGNRSSRRRVPRLFEDYLDGAAQAVRRVRPAAAEGVVRDEFRFPFGRRRRRGDGLCGIGG